MSGLSSDRVRRTAIAVVVVNWRNALDTVQCLDSLRAAFPGAERVFVVDNGSADGSVERFTQWASDRDVSFEVVRGVDGYADPREDHAVRAAPTPWLTIVRLAANLGFSGGNNVGLAVAERETDITHFLLLNNDAIVAADYFAEMRRALEARPEAGLYVGTIYELANRDRVWFAGGRMHPWRALALHDLRIPTGTEWTTTEFVTGCAMVIPRTVLERVGLLAECYFPGYMEDVEYSWRVRASGLDLIYAPRALVYHKVGATFGARSVSPLTAYHQNRHRLYFVRRNLRGLQRVAAMVYMAVTKPGRALIDVLQGRPEIGWATLRGTAAGLFSRPRDTRLARLRERYTSAPLVSDGAPR